MAYEQSSEVTNQKMQSEIQKISGIAPESAVPRFSNINMKHLVIFIMLGFFIGFGFTLFLIKFQKVKVDKFV